LVVTEDKDLAEGGINGNFYFMKSRAKRKKESKEIKRQN
jgi:hypothetical protein